MDLNRKFFIESVANEVRNKIVEKEIIQADACELTIDQVKSIIEFFDGKLELAPETEEFTPYIKENGDSYIIYYKESNSFLSLLHELGHAFLHYPEKPRGDKKRLNFNGNEKADMEAALFARALVMPRKRFEEVIIKYLYDGKCKIHDVAKEYKIEYLEVLARGEELNIWE